MVKKRKISRRSFLKLFTAALALLLGELWISMADNSLKNRTKQEKIFLPDNLPKGITLADKIIIINKGGELKIFLSRCTHLGCKLSSIEENKIICPCHGSQFDNEGVPIKGPALKSLEQIDYFVDKKSGSKFVYA